jgi:hypothetical protein
MQSLDKNLVDAEIIQWAMTNRSCKITQVPQWVIMTLLEDVVYHDCHLIETLVMALDNSQGAVMQNGHLELAAETLMTKVLLASLYDDGHIDIGLDLPDDPRLFEFQHQVDLQITLTASGEQAQVWKELDLFGGVASEVVLH